MPRAWPEVLGEDEVVEYAPRFLEQAGVGLVKGAAQHADSVGDVGLHGERSKEESAHERAIFRHDGRVDVILRVDGVTHKIRQLLARRRLVFLAILCAAKVLVRELVDVVAEREGYVRVML